MKIIFAALSLALMLLVVGPAVSHHAAEGIIADELYEEINERLDGSPHLDMEMVDVQTVTMSETTGESNSETMRQLTITVSSDDVAVVFEELSELMGQGFDPTAESPMESSLEITVSDPTDCAIEPEDQIEPDVQCVTVTIVEHIGQGKSQPWED
jgi:hypothetical protein